MSDLLRAGRAPTEVITILAAEEASDSPALVATTRGPCESGRKLKKCHGVGERVSPPES